jgi:hypothetical protein
MKLEPSSRISFKGFTKADLLAILFSLGFLAIVLIVAVVTPSANNKPRSPLIKCINNFKQIGLAFALIENEENQSLSRPPYPPIQGGVLERIKSDQVYRHFRVASNELNHPMVLVCPSDERTKAPNFSLLRNENISYFLTFPDHPMNPEDFLAGDRNLAVNQAQVKSGLAIIPPDAEANWTSGIHKNAGNVLLRDGSVHQMNSDRLKDSIKGQAKTVRLLVP